MRWLAVVNWEFAIGVVLGVLGIALAVYHVRELKRTTKLAECHTDRLASVTKQLSTVHGELSTRYIGEFPYFIADIVKLLEHAKRKTVIFCDFPGYGFFSDPANALMYEQALDRKKADVDLSLTCLTPASRLRLQREQFSSADWKGWQTDKQLLAKVTRFLATHAIGVNVATVTYEELIDVQERIDVDLIQRVFGSTRTVEIDSYLPLHFWVVDDTTAIFSIPTFSEAVLEYGFKTSDQTLIEALLLIPDRYRRDPSGGAADPCVYREATDPSRITAKNGTAEPPPNAIPPPKIQGR